MNGTELRPVPDGIGIFNGTIPKWRIEDLTRGGTEAQILHGGSIYRLRITSNQKLILTK